MKAGKEYRFVRFEDGWIHYCNVSHEGGDTYGYLSLVGDMVMLHEFMTEAVCEASLEKEGYIDLRKARDQALIPADIKFPEESCGEIRKPGPR